MLWNWYNKVTEEFPWSIIAPISGKNYRTYSWQKTTSTELNKTLKISTIHQWIKKYKETGNLKRSPGSGKKTKIDNPDSTQKELGQLYGCAS